MQQINNLIMLNPNKKNKSIKINSQDFKNIEEVFYTYLKDNNNQSIQSTFNKIIDQLQAQYKPYCWYIQNTI